MATQTYNSSVPAQTATYNSNDPALRKDVRQLKLINLLSHVFAWLFLAGSVIWLAGNAVLLRSYTRNLNQKHGWGLFIAGVAIMCIASWIAWFGHILDLFRSIRKHIFSFLLVLNFLASTCFFAGFLLLAIGGGLLLRAIRRFNYDNYNSNTASNYNSAANLTSSGLVLCTIGAGVGSLGIISSLLLHQFGTIRRVRRHPPRPYTVSHLRNWIALGGSLDFLIAFVILDVSCLAAVIVQNVSFIRQFNILNIISAAFFILGAIRAIYTTFPRGTLYSDAFANPTIPADKVLVAPGAYNANVHAVTSTGVSLPVVSETGLPVGVAPAPVAPYSPAATAVAPAQYAVPAVVVPDGQVVNQV